MFRASRTDAVRRIAPLLTCLLAVAATAYAARQGETPWRGRSTASATGTIWTPAEWRMPLDNWGTGLAWRGTGPDGAAIRLFARTKTGFCNCFDGIADDIEIDRIGDVDLHGGDFSAVAPGQAAAVGALPGRTRAFRTADRWTGTRHVLSIVAAADCKAVVATLVSDAPISPMVEASARALLTGETFRQWSANQ